MTQFSEKDKAIANRLIESMMDAVRKHDLDKLVAKFCDYIQTYPDLDNGPYPKDTLVQFIYIMRRKYEWNMKWEFDKTEPIFYTRDENEEIVYH